MTVFSAIEHKLPPDNVKVPPEAWASTWDDRPTEEVVIGLRFVPDAELEDARVEALRRAERLFPKHEKDRLAREQYEQSFSDALLRWVVARGTCDPNNVEAPWEGWSDAPEDIAVEQALTDVGAQLIFDAWERMRLSADIGLPVASDEDLSLLPHLLRRLPVLAGESRAREQRLRRLLRFVLEELEAVEDPPGEAGATPTRVDAAPPLPPP